MKKHSQNRWNPLLVVLAITLFVGLIAINVIIANKKDEPVNYLVNVDKHGVEILQTTEPTVMPHKTPLPTGTPIATPEVSERPHKVMRVTLAAVGDDLIHSQVVRSGKRRDGSYNFDHLFEKIKPDIKKADIAVINQETVLGGKSLTYSGYPRFNSPTEIGDAIVNAGFDVVQHATNHAMDKGEVGLQNTIDFWKKHSSITTVGVNETKEQQDTICVVEKNGIRIAMLNYTYGLNGLSLPANRKYMVNLLEEEKVRSDIEAAKKCADFIVVFPHWGSEYVYKPTKVQEKWANLFLECGVDLVIGAHPHVLEPVEWLEDEQGHKMLVYYSLGNYISAQTKEARMLGGLANITIEMTEGEKAKIVEASITPLVTHFTSKFNEYAVYKLDDYTEELARQHKLAKSGLSKRSLEKLASTILGEWNKKSE